MALRADCPERRAVPVTDRYRAWVWAPHSDRKPPVTLRNTTEGLNLALGDVVGGWHVAVGEEDEEPASPCLDLFEQHLACRMPDGHAHPVGCP